MKIPSGLLRFSIGSSQFIKLPQANSFRLPPQTKLIFQEKIVPKFLTSNLTPKEPKANYTLSELKFPPVKSLAPSLAEADQLLVNARQSFAQIMGRNPDLVLSDVSKSTLHGTGPLSPLVQQQEMVSQLKQMTVGLLSFAREHGG